MSQNIGGRPRAISDEQVERIGRLTAEGRSVRAIARLERVSKSVVARALAAISPEPTPPPSAPQTLTSGERRLARAILLQGLRDATGEVQPGDKSLERRVAQIDACRFFGAVERARDLEVVAGLAKLAPGMVLDAMQQRDRAEIRKAIETETRLSLNLGMDL